MSISDPNKPTSTTTQQAPPKPTPTKTSFWTENFKGLGAGFCTLVVLVVLVVWIIVTASYVGSTPQLATDTTGALDKFANAKDVLLAILPLATTSLGYWYGNQGADKAKATADEATAQATQAKADTTKAKDQLAAVLDVAQPETLAKAKALHQDAF